ncbi:MAG: hypothetical protein IJB64_06595 [Akkermansia sp.]|nr:hypothetical protein [Akkermansia sp.]
MREFKRGDIVSVKKEWLNPGESADMYYVVLEESGPGRVLVQALGTGLPLAPTSVMAVEWLEYAGHIPES